MVVYGFAVEMEVEFRLRAAGEFKEYWTQRFVLRCESLERLTLKAAGEVVAFSGMPRVAEVVKCLI
ncbi:MAG: hypothetical protein B7Y93_03895 [Micrococcales bacterium 32-70-13]|nr:MAG: hypothetical protein B7Y93_03895 [Micrococcales bacterium 32-70-13]